MWSSWILQLALALSAAISPAHSLGTHANITSKVVEYTIANGLSCPDATRATKVLDSLLQIGTLHEDDWTESTEQLRSQIKTQFGRDLSNETLLLLGQTLVLGRFNFHFTPRLTDPAAGVDASCSSFDWAFGNQPCTYTSLVPELIAKGDPGLKNVKVTLRNSFNWDAAVAQAKQPAGNTGFAQGFATLGYVLHLLEDLTSPAHSRNDAHAWTDPDWMEYRMPDGLAEEWAQMTKLSGLPEMVRVPALPANAPLAAEAIKPIDLFEALHTHVSSNFYSKSTVAFKAPGPILHDSLAVSCQSSKGVVWARYVCAPNGRIVAKGNFPIERTPGVILASKSITWPTQLWIDEALANEQWKELGPLAVRYGARLVMLYARTAAPMMPCTVK